MRMHTNTQTDTHVASHASLSQTTQERSYVTLYQLKLQFKILLPSVYVYHSEPLSALCTIDATERIPMNQSLPNLPPAHFPTVQLFCSCEHWSMCFGLVERWQRELEGEIE